MNGPSVMAPPRIDVAVDVGPSPTPARIRPPRASIWASTSSLAWATSGGMSSGQFGDIRS
jgi:hypothetical protein